MKTVGLVRRASTGEISVVFINLETFNFSRKALNGPEYDAYVSAGYVVGMPGVSDAEYALIPLAISQL